MSRPRRPRPRRSRAGGALTERELEVLALVASGEPTPAIGQRLGIAENTVKSHLTKIYDKTGSRNRVDAVRYYLDHDTTSPAGSHPAHTARQRPLIQRQIQELETRIDQLKPAAGELQRLQRALDALRSVDDASSTDPTPGARPATGEPTTATTRPRPSNTDNTG